MAMAEWLQSTFHRYVAQGVYPVDWGGSRFDMVAMILGE
jgi:hypothetical protein